MPNTPAGHGHVETPVPSLHRDSAAAADLAAQSATSTDAHWATLLFAGTSTAPTATPEVISARAAYQDALHGRGVLLDARPSIQRAQVGTVAAALAPLALDGDDPWLIALALAALATPILVLDAEPEFVDRLRTRVSAEVLTVHGGFAAWSAAGLPRTAPAGDVNASEAIATGRAAEVAA